MAEKGYKKLFAWQKADELAYQVYITTGSFPREEKYGLSSQLRRAVLSIPTNLVEGSGRQSRKEMRQFVVISMGSLAEVEYLLEFSKRLGYLSEERYLVLEKQRTEVGRVLWGLLRSFENH